MKKDKKIDWGKTGEFIFHMHSMERELSKEYQNMQRQKFHDQAAMQIAIAKLNHPFLSLFDL